MQYSTTLYNTLTLEGPQSSKSMQYSTNTCWQLIDATYVSAFNETRDLFQARFIMNAHCSIFYWILYAPSYKLKNGHCEMNFNLLSPGRHLYYPTATSVLTG